MKTRRSALALAVIGATLTLAAFGGSGNPAAAAMLPSSTASTSSLLPAPTGTFAVGVRTVPGVAPDATTRVWYPARRGSGTAGVPYLTAQGAAAAGVTAEQVRQVRVVARADARAVSRRRPRPAVVLMPGWGSPMALSTSLAEDLASNGYVVVTVDPDVGSEDGMTMSIDGSRRFGQLDAALDFLTGPRITAFVGRVDVHRLAVGGHSIAGAEAFQASLGDPRIAAVFDLDGWLHGPALTTPVSVPALVVNASGLEPATKAILARTPSAVTVELEGATHGDVTDLPCLVPVLGGSASALGLGAIGCTGTTTTNALVQRFLDVVLVRGRPTPSPTRLASRLAGVVPAR